KVEGNQEIKDVRFGIQRNPEAIGETLTDVVNPGEDNYYEVPAAAFSGNDDGDLGNSTLTIVGLSDNIARIKVGVSEYDREGDEWDLSSTVIKVGLDEDGHPKDPISIDPDDGNREVSISFTITDEGALVSEPA